MRDVDKYGLPLSEFGEGVPPAFFEILGRLLAVNGKIEYLKDRLDHLPSVETGGVKKVEQFLKRYGAGRTERNAIVHSTWVFGAQKDPEVIVGFRYKVGKSVLGATPTVAIRDVLGSEKSQDVVEYTLDDLRRLLKRDIATMLVGQLAHGEVDGR
jgi:hypothetical protein